MGSHTHTHARAPRGFLFARSELVDPAGCSAPVSQYGLQTQPCGTQIVVGHYNTNMRAGSRAEKSYLSMTDRERAYAIVTELTQNAVDAVTTAVNAAAIAAKLRVTRGIRSFTDRDSGLMSGRHVRYRRTLTRDRTSLVIETSLPEVGGVGGGGTGGSSGAVTWRPLLEIMVDRASRTFYMVQIGQAMLDATECLPIGTTSKDPSAQPPPPPPPPPPTSTSLPSSASPPLGSLSASLSLSSAHPVPAYSSSSSSLSTLASPPRKTCHDDIVPQAGGHGVGAKQIMLLSCILGFVLWIGGTVLAERASATSGDGGEGDAEKEEESNTSAAVPATVAVTAAGRRIAFMQPELPDSKNATVGVRGGLLRREVPIVAEREHFMFDPAIRPYLGAAFPSDDDDDDEDEAATTRPRDLLVHRVRFVSDRFDMADVERAARVAYVMFDGPVSVSLNTRDDPIAGGPAVSLSSLSSSPSDSLDHAAIIERDRSTSATTWVNGVALSTVFTHCDDTDGPQPQHPNVLLVTPAIERYSKYQRGDQVERQRAYSVLGDRLTAACTNVSDDDEGGGGADDDGKDGDAADHHSLWFDAAFRACVAARRHDTSLASFLFDVGTDAVKRRAAKFVPVGVAYHDEEVERHEVIFF